MNLFSSLRMFVAIKTGVPSTRKIAPGQERWPEYVVCAGLGLVGGATGVALAIGLAIVVQLLLPPVVIFSPGAIPLMIAGVLVGLAVSWLLERGTQHLLSKPAPRSSGQALQVILTISAFTSLSEILLFTYGL